MIANENLAAGKHGASDTSSPAGFKKTGFVYFKCGN